MILLPRAHLKVIIRENSFPRTLFQTAKYSFKSTIIDTGGGGGLYLLWKQLMFCLSSLTYTNGSQPLVEYLYISSCLGVPYCVKFYCHNSKGEKFCDFLYTLLGDKLSRKWSILKGKNMLI